MYAEVGRLSYYILIVRGLSTTVVYRGQLPENLSLFIEQFDDPNSINTNIEEIEAEIDIPVGYIKYPRRSY